MKLPELPDLPVRAVLDEVVETLAEHGTAVLVAPPGTGKTTLVPLALAAGTSGRVVVAEPRRLAARAAAGRMAALLGESVGGTVGYSVRGDRRVGPGTRVEVVTSGLLVRRLQNDPELAGVDVVVLDECHERHLDADLLLALLLDARAGLRPDLRVLATSATVAADRLAALLGGAGPAVELLGGVSSAPGAIGGADQAAEVVGSGGAALELVGGAGRAPILEVHGRAYPVEMEYISALPKERVEAHVARVTRSALAGSDGDVLVFLPGAAEIRRVAAQLSGLTDIDVMPLHGRLSGAAQDAALRQGSRRRVVLSTAVAESSLTVPGVRVVVDSGLARVPRVDHRRGLSGLATVRVSAAVAEQRAGRAGREAPGWAWRCWPEYEHATLPAYPEPEIRTADLTRLALELACWGTADGQGLGWWDPPPPGALAAGREVLRALGAEESDGTVTARGRRMAALGLHPRLARALLDGAAAVGARSAAEVVALLDDDTIISTVDLVAGIRTLRADPPQRWKREVDRLTRLVEGVEAESTRTPKTSSRPVESAEAEPARTPQGSSRVIEGAGTGSTNKPKADGRGRGGATAASSPRAADAALSARATDDLALVAALAYPERLARRRGPGSPSYLMAGGTAVSLPPGSGVGEAEWLAVAGASRDPGCSEGRIRLAAIADEQLARQAAPDLVVTADEVDWVDGDVVARRVERLGAIILSEKPLRNPDRVLVERALRRGLASVGPDLLRWNTDALALRQRLDFLHRTLGAPWPEMNDQALLADTDSWLGPELATANRRADLERVDAGQVLRRLLPWPEAVRFDELAPERLEVPSGSRVRIDYSGDFPVLAVKVQEIFGWADLPRLADGRTSILLHLLSPAQRPIAVTTDLASFWRTGWPQVRAELRGRYPKHAWPEDPTTVPAHRGTSRRIPRD
ncbi:helicase-related protein [Nocardia sp. NBC_01503]|uniref:ATP-dependent RNA helicase n=1 Tax=Nocardia sp. NBC_01503 TaxID=2975997 RepID=UPI002E7BC096|nr:ATP-dependent helicase C-terminal domain-containing protein [Nocardia sp. NBC_01503]WTL35668.1 helicase-related protein [Nocardia sp. NBC_01503]